MKTCEPYWKMGCWVAGVTMLACGGKVASSVGKGAAGTSGSSASVGTGSGVPGSTSSASGSGAGGSGPGGSGASGSGAGGSGPGDVTVGAGGAGTSVGTGGSGGFGAGGRSYCDPSRWPGFGPQPITLADCSDFDSAVAPNGIHCIMPGGVWDVDTDGLGTSKGDSFRIEPCGTTGNGFHFHGKGHMLWGAEAAAAIVSQTQPVDVSAFSGMSFVMKSATPNTLFFKVQNSYSQPTCGKCDDLITGAECYSGYFKWVQLPATDTTPIVVRWSELAQQSWGYRAPGTAMFDTHDLVSVAFAFDKDVDFDVCIDDIKFVR